MDNTIFAVQLASVQLLSNWLLIFFSLPLKKAEKATLMEGGAHKCTHTFMRRRRKSSKRNGRNLLFTQKIDLRIDFFCLEAISSGL